MSNITYKAYMLEQLFEGNTYLRILRRGLRGGLRRIASLWRLVMTSRSEDKREQRKIASCVLSKMLSRLP